MPVWILALPITTCVAWDWDQSSSLHPYIHSFNTLFFSMTMYKFGESALCATVFSFMSQRFIEIMSVKQWGQCLAHTRCLISDSDNDDDGGGGGFDGGDGQVCLLDFVLPRILFLSEKYFLLIFPYNFSLTAPMSLLGSKTMISHSRFKKWGRRRSFSPLLALSRF